MPQFWRPIPLDLPLDSEHARHLVPCRLVMWDGCGRSMPKRGQEMVCNRVSHRCLLRRLHHERSRGNQMVPREPSDIARIGMLGAKRELLSIRLFLQNPVRVLRTVTVCGWRANIRRSPPTPRRIGGRREVGPLTRLYLTIYCGAHPTLYTHGSRASPTVLSPARP